MRIFYAIKLPRSSSEQKVVTENVAASHLTREHTLKLSSLSVTDLGEKNPEQKNRSAITSEPR